MRNDKPNDVAVGEVKGPCAGGPRVDREDGRGLRADLVPRRTIFRSRLPAFRWGGGGGPVFILRISEALLATLSLYRCTLILLGAFRHVVLWNECCAMTQTGLPPPPLCRGMGPLGTGHWRSRFLRRSLLTTEASVAYVRTCIQHWARPRSLRRTLQSHKGQFNANQIPYLPHLHSTTVAVGLPPTPGK